MPSTRKQPEEKKYNPLVGDLSLEEIIREMDFAEEEVEHAARTLPKLWIEAARQRIRYMRIRQQALAQVDMIKADVAIKLRADAEKSGKKLTVQAVAELVDNDPELRVAQRKLDHAKEIEELLKLLLQGLEMKKSAIKVVADKQKADAWMENPTAVPDSMAGLDMMKSRLQQKYNRTPQSEE